MHKIKIAHAAGTETIEEAKNTDNERAPRHRSMYPRNRRAVPSPSEDVPATSRTQRMAQEMKKLRSLHILHVPHSRSETKAR